MFSVDNMIWKICFSKHKCEGNEVLLLFEEFYEGEEDEKSFSNRLFDIKGNRSIKSSIEALISIMMIRRVVWNYDIIKSR